MKKDESITKSKESESFLYSPDIEAVKDATLISMTARERPVLGTGAGHRKLSTNTYTCLSLKEAYNCG
jgi:hypothetical protein